jgi:hypothetical protein
MPSSRNYRLKAEKLSFLRSMRVVWTSLSTATPFNEVDLIILEQLHQQMVQSGLYSAKTYHRDAQMSIFNLIGEIRKSGIG